MSGPLFNSINPLHRRDIEYVASQPVDRIRGESNNATVFQYFDGFVDAVTLLDEIDYPTRFRLRQKSQLFCAEIFNQKVLNHRPNAWILPHIIMSRRLKSQTEIVRPKDKDRPGHQPVEGRESRCLI